MLKKTITYEDYNGNSQTEAFYFNLSKAELVELQVSEDEGFAETLTRIAKSGNGREIVANFKKIILLAYGVRSEDGRRFVKSDELREDFSQTEAYSELFIELSTDAEAASEFINGIVPQNMDDLVEKAKEIEDVEPTAFQEGQEATDDKPDWERENREPTKKELTEMSREELLRAMQAKNQQ